MKIRIGSRQSPLAKWQANFINSKLQELGCEVEMVWLVTQGDVTTTPLSQAEGVGVFTKAIQQALLDKRCDVAVHSLKDLPTAEIAGLRLSATTPRENPHDCLLSNRWKSLDELPQAAIVGTGSPRRVVQLKTARPDLDIRQIRGNVETRIAKLDSGEFDAIVLAAAGLHRLDLESRITQYLPFEIMLPAVGQAALGMECRRDDVQVIESLRQINDELTWQSIQAERAALRTLQAGCLTPMAAHAICTTERIDLELRLFSDDASRHISTKCASLRRGNLEDINNYGSNSGESTGEALGKFAASQLIIAGAEDLL